MKVSAHWISGTPKGGLMLNSDLSPADPQGGRLPPTDKTRVVSTRRRVLKNWVSGRTIGVVLRMSTLDTNVDGSISASICFFLEQENLSALL